MLKTGFSFDISIILYTFAHVNNKTIKIMETKHIYVVTHVSLSDDDYDENGSTTVAVADTLDDAKKILNQWKDEEVDELIRRNEPWEVLANEETEFRMSWCSHGYQIRIKIHTI
jgi:hypothetical protein